MKYLITGITGFAGPHLASLLLNKKHEIHAVVRASNGREIDLLDILMPNEHEKIIFHYLDLKHYYGVKKLIDKEKFDGIFHLAAQSHPPTSFKDPIMTFEDNVMASLNLITAIEKTDTKFMFCSTSEVYGDSCKDDGILRITNKLFPSNPYAVTKASIDLYMQERMNNGFIKGYITRAFSHTGPRRGKIFSISSDAFQIAKMKLGLKEKILDIGNLGTKRIVIDVRDCVNAYYLLMINDKSNGNIFNVCGEDIHKMQFFTDTLIKLAGFDLSEVEQRINPKFWRDIDIQIQRGDSTELKNLTGWKPVIDITTTLKNLLAYWIRKIGNNI